MKLPKITLLILLTLLTAGCESENEFPSVERNNAEPLPVSMKGYELYSWKVSNKHYYTLVTGTNRIKTREEIMSDVSFEEEGYLKFTTSSLDELVQTLLRMPENQFISWTSPAKFSFPSPMALLEIKTVCKQLNLDLAIVD